MSGSRVEHRFAVIMCADVVGYSRLMGIDEEGTLAQLNTVRRNLFDPTIAEHRGRIVRAMGDGLLVEFNSVVDAVRCAVKVQSEMPQHTEEMPADRRIWFRVAIAMGDVVTDGDLIYGQGVDTASRMESLAEPGGINVSRAVRDQVRDRLPIALRIWASTRSRALLARSRLPCRAGHAQRGAGRPTAAKAAARPESRGLVVPVQNLGGDAGPKILPRQRRRGLITELRERGGSLSSPATRALATRARAPSQAIARALGVRYVVGQPPEGRQPRPYQLPACRGRQRRTSVGERLTARSKNSFDLRDQITESLVGSVGPVLRAEVEPGANRSEPGRL